MYSVVVPIYKVQEYLPQCIESILSQTHRDFELILVNDGSPDGCPEICDRYAEMDGRIKVIHKKNGGLVSARKAGLEKSTGEYVCFVDGDDFVLADMLEKFEEILVSEKYDVVCTEYAKYRKDGQVVPVKQNIEVGAYDKSRLTDIIYPKMLSSSKFYSFGVMPNVFTKCIKKKILCEIYAGIPDEISLGEDVAVTYPALLKANNVFFSDYCGYMYRENLQSMTHTYDRNLYDKVRNLLLYLRAFKHESKWEDNGQIDEYSFFLLVLAKNNEFKYSEFEKYHLKRKKMQRYISDPLFSEALKNIKLHEMRYKFLRFCFRKNFLIPVYFYESVLKASGGR